MIYKYINTSTVKSCLRGDNCYRAVDSVKFDITFDAVNTTEIFFALILQITPREICHMCRYCSTTPVLRKPL